MTGREKGLFVGCGIAACGMAIGLAVIALIVAFIALGGRGAAPMPATATVIVEADGEWIICATGAAGAAGGGRGVAT